MPSHVAAFAFGEPGLDRLRPSSAKHLAELHFGVIAVMALLTLLLLALTQTPSSDFSGAMWLTGSLLVSSCLARWEVHRDHLPRAMDLHAIGTAVPAAALAIGSASPVMALVTLMSHLPMYALVRGLRRSALLLAPPGLAGAGRCRRAGAWLAVTGLVPWCARGAAHGRAWRHGCCAAAVGALAA